MRPYPKDDASGEGRVRRMEAWMSDAEWDWWLENAYPGQTRPMARVGNYVFASAVATVRERERRERQIRLGEVEACPS